MFKLEDMLVKVEPQAVLQELFEGYKQGANISCPFAKEKHENGTDKSKSFSLSADGKAFCHACGYRATTIVNLYNDIYGYDFVDGCKSFYSAFIENLVPDEYVEQAHKTLLSNPIMLERLRLKRGLTLGTVKLFKLGWSAGRLTIPIYNEFNFCVNVRKYDLLGHSQVKILSYEEGFGKARLFPVPSKTKVYLFEGEMDTLLACQYGLNAVTSTGGALTWTEEMSKAFIDKDIVIVPDIDKVGLEGLQKRGEALLPYAKSINVIKLPVKGTKENKDFTDFLLGNVKGKMECFYALKPYEFLVKVKHEKEDNKKVQNTDTLSFTPTATESVNLDRAKSLLSYMKGNGAFFKNIMGILFYARKGGDIIRVDVKDSNFMGFLCALSPLLNTAAASGKFVIQHLINSAQILCSISKSAFWSILQGKDFFMYGRNGELIHFIDGKYDRIPNAINKHGMLLELPHHTQPFNCIGGKFNVGVELLWEKVMSNIAISNENRYLLLCWLLGIIFRVEIRNKPLMRLSASTAFGKSTASKLLSILLYGEEVLHHSASTMASMYSLATEYPLLLLDNLETRNMTQPLEDFLIVAATGGMKSKRLMDTNIGVMFERIDSLVLTNGIEPFSKHEILNRTIELPLNIDRFGKAHFHELKVIEDLKANRDLIMFTLMSLMSKRVIPRFISGEVQRIARHFDSHSKERFNEYFGVMAIILDSIWPYIPCKGYALPHDLVNYWIASQNVSSRDSDEGTNDILYFLDTYFKRHDRLLDFGVPLVHKKGYNILYCTPRDLLSEFRLLAKHLSMKCPWSNERQLGTRLADASTILYKAGWEKRQVTYAGKRVYEFIKKAN